VRVAFQLTNILRDIREDADRGRIYLPAEDLRRFGATEGDLRAGRRNAAFLGLMRHEAARARAYYEESRPLLELIHPRSRRALWALIAIYSRLLDRIESGGYDVFSRRVRLSALEKSGLWSARWLCSVGQTIVFLSSANRPWFGEAGEAWQPQKTMARPTLLHQQTHLARVVCRRLGPGQRLEIVEVGVEPADQLIQLEGGFPNIEKQAAPRARAPDAALPVDSGTISFVSGAASFELPGSNLQGGQAFSTPFSVSPFIAVLKIAYALAESFGHFRDLLSSK